MVIIAGASDITTSAPVSRQQAANGIAWRVAHGPVATTVSARPAVRAMTKRVSLAISSSVRKKNWLSPTVSRITPLPPAMAVSMIFATPVPVDLAGIIKRRGDGRHRTQ